MLYTLFQIAIGGALGAVARFGTTQAFDRAFGPEFPYGTAFVNICGSFLMGVLFVFLDARGLTHHAPLLLAGLLGGFTTFSAFSLDAFRLWETGGAAVAALYVLGSVVLSILALMLGILTMRAFA